ncbi:acyl-CoA dehydrogenase, middle domain protein [Cooperia oncophora]
MDKNSRMDPSVIDGVFKNGFMGVEVPEAYGGPGTSFFETVLIVEELAKIGSFCLSEPGSGSDAFALKTNAKPDGNDFIINGSKLWITSSSHAHFFLVFANADPSKGHKGITCFLVDRNQKGVSVDKEEDKWESCLSHIPVHSIVCECP